MSKRFEHLHSETLARLAGWEGFLSNEGMSDDTDRELADEIDATLRSRLPNHEYAAPSYPSGYCGYFDQYTHCMKTREQHEAER